ncbi:ABC-type antimicrobial peptide transport system, ATPase component [Desulfitobacterium dichloroeliminans LMG P-21439]|uniref:ABC-type antimicrobial peptide transport system, ATPase component n=1 Tax=Desulfitobacterium dichloroeliminans (strain LMG P-21439 / DCA1) TaxID=871963 RepID=L0F5F9_DESDL|nr:ABC transporter ATP-binding protein [Desulfitobacterium dichloroeliminans]AGA68280.1 ABC-type antimicrobial peptide transport system, ATPase component [Desulfitobacterium dichloroeliminans LMG P-21439]
MELCRLEKVSKTYEVGDAVCPVHELSLTVNAGEFMAIEGPSGTGKSTLLYLMSGLLRPTQGDVFIQNQNLSTLPDPVATELRRQMVGFIFQETNLFQALTVEGNLRFVQSLGKNKPNLKKIAHYLEELGLSERRLHLPHQLSVGQRRRLVVARALINDAPLILADEPTNDLDDLWAGKVMELLAGVVEGGGAVVMVTHNSHWARQAHHRYGLQEGRLTLCV